jgi:hydrogenase maturation protease
MENSDFCESAQNSEQLTYERHRYLNNIHKTVAVISGKGGVGKSFTTALLAAKLTSEGYKVGILDANFSTLVIPDFFGVKGPAQKGEYSFIPLQSSSGVRIISASLLFRSEDRSIVWKEALKSGVIKELWYEIEWGDLDYLLIDMPPANSETSVAIMQILPIFGVILVTAPQLSSVKMTNRSISIYQRLGKPFIGVIENMAYLRDPDTGKNKNIFGQSRGEAVANVAKAPFLSRIHFDPNFSRLSENGKIEDIPLDEFDELLESFIESISTVEEMITNNNDQDQTTSIDSSTNEEELHGMSNSCEYTQESSHAQNFFSDTVIYLIQSKENVGTLDHPDAQGLFLGSCGDRMQIDLKIFGEKIIDAKFVADGCGATYACGTMITKMVCTKTLDEANQITSEELLDALDGLPEDHLHCAELAVMTLREAVIDAIEGHKIKSK